jgi:hypothetical protein
MGSGADAERQRATARDVAQRLGQRQGVAAAGDVGAVRRDADTQRRRSGMYGCSAGASGTHPPWGAHRPGGVEPALHYLPLHLRLDDARSRWLLALPLIEATIAGWQIGVLLRSVSLVLVFGMLGVGVLHLRFNRRMQDQDWVRGLVSAWWMVLVAILAIVVAIVLIGGVLVAPKTPFWLQPTVQGVIAIVIGGIIYLLASRRAESQGLNVFAQAQRELPLE